MGTKYRDANPRGNEFELGSRKLKRDDLGEIKVGKSQVNGKMGDEESRMPQSLQDSKKSKGELNT